jgi:hypothetical protein
MNETRNDVIRKMLTGWGHCVECRISFEPKTPVITWGGYDYHHGCFEAMRQKGAIIT